MRTIIAAVACSTLLLPQVRAQPAQAGQAFDLLGKGVQIYICTSGTWALKAPEAVLFDTHDVEVGHHFAGPSWQGRDGSLVAGAAEYTASGGPGNVPWLVLRATAHSGQGLFATVKAVTRTRTQGGVAPADGCDAARGGAEVRVPYTATYSFLPE